MKRPVARRARNSSAQCCHHTATGRRCRSICSTSDSCLCPRHRTIEQKLLSAEPDDLTPEFTDLEDSLQTVDGIHNSLAELYILVAQDRISPRRAAVLAYVSSLLLRSLAITEKNAAKSKPPQNYSWNWSDCPAYKTAVPAQQSATNQNAAKPQDLPNAATPQNVPGSAHLPNSPANPSAPGDRSVPAAVNLANSPANPSVANRKNVPPPASPPPANLADISNGIHMGDFRNYHDGIRT